MSSNRERSGETSPDQDYVPEPGAYSNRFREKRERFDIWTGGIALVLLAIAGVYARLRH